MKNFRTDLVNYLVGISGSIIALFYLLRSGVRGEWWEKILGYAFYFIAAVAAGWLLAFGINMLQGQNHQTADSVDAEEKRSIKGAFYTTISITLLSLFIDISQYEWIPKAGVGVFVFAVALWGVPALYKKIKARLAKKN